MDPQYKAQSTEPLFTLKVPLEWWYMKVPPTSSILHSIFHLYGLELKLNMVKISTELQIHTLFLFFLPVDKLSNTQSLGWWFWTFIFVVGKGDLKHFFSSNTSCISKYFPLSTSSENILNTKAFTRLLNPWILTLSHCKLFIIWSV